MHLRRITHEQHLSKPPAIDGETLMGQGASQRLLLERYAQTNGFENTLFLADDGYSGTDFERPSWKTVTELIEADEVETLSDFSQPPDFAVRGL